MIVFDKKKIVFASNPKTGTHTMYKMLQRFGGRRFGGYHQTKFPKRFEPKFVFTTIREPLTRTVSAWNSLMFHENKHRNVLVELIGSDDFASYCDWLCDGDPDRVYGGKYLAVVLTNQSSWLNQVTCQFPIDYYVRTEYMAADMAHLPINIPKGYLPPKELKRTEPEFIQRQLDTLSGQQLNRLEEHLKDDFELYYNHQ